MGSKIVRRIAASIVCVAAGATLFVTGWGLGDAHRLSVQDAAIAHCLDALDKGDAAVVKTINLAQNMHDGVNAWVAGSGEAQTINEQYEPSLNAAELAIEEYIEQADECKEMAK